MNLSQFDLNLLVSLDALLIERNVTRAGQRVGLSQPAMSGTLARLRDLFKDELLVRVGRQLELTPLAQELAPVLHERLREIEDLLSARRTFVPASEHRTFVIAASDYVTFMLLQPLVARLAEQAPGISIRFTRLAPNSPDHLGEDAVDFVIMPSEMEARYPFTPLFADRWVCVAWEGNGRIGENLDMQQYLSLPHLVWSMPGEGSASLADTTLERLGLRRHIIAWTESFVLSPFMVRGTDMVSVVQERVARKLQAAAGIRILDLPYEAAEIHESLHWNPRRSADPPHVWLREQVLAAASAI
jgi:DNA-binding transcriptional LysR family regulator